MADIIKTYLYVDEGDTCTAPMAAAIANLYAEEKGLDVTFFSAGIYAKEGLDLDPKARKALKDLYGIELGTHASRPLTPELFRSYPLVRTVLYRLNAFVNDRAFAWPNDGNFSIVKPSGKDDSAYRACAENLSKNIKNQLDRMIGEGRFAPKAD